MILTEGNDKKCTAFLSVHNYVFDLVLPKCNIVFGNKFSSVYIQVLLNINNDALAHSWQKNKCWMGPKTIARNIGSNERKVMLILKQMESVGLVKKSYRGKLFMFSLQNHKISDMDKVLKFNDKLDKELLKHVKEKNELTTQNKFTSINNAFKDSANYYYGNLVELKGIVAATEKIQSGSSLMFLRYFADSFLKLNSYNSKITNVSEKKMAIQMGMSQPTISRYLKSFQNEEYFKMEYNKATKNSIIFINKELLLMSKEITETNLDCYKCPVCGKEVVSIKKLNSHIKRCKDELHVFFRQKQEEYDAFTMEELTNVYEQHKERFLIASKKHADKKQLNSMAMDLVKYYYSLTETRCPNWPKEIGIIKSQLVHGMPAEDIREVMRFMSRRAYQDLRFFSNSINDAFIIKQCRLDVKTKGTDAYLVKMYFSKMGQSLNDRLMLQAINKIKELKTNGYTYDQITTIVEYMIDKRCPSFNFIVNMANEALKNAKNKNEMAKAYTTDELVNAALEGDLEYGIIMMKDRNYDMAKKEIILRLKEDLCAGKVDLTRVNATYNKFAVALANEIFKRNLYDINLTPQQWINQTQLHEVSAY